MFNLSWLRLFLEEQIQPSLKVWMTILTKSTKLKLIPRRTLSDFIFLFFFIYLLALSLCKIRFFCWEWKKPSEKPLEDWINGCNRCLLWTVRVIMTFLALSWVVCLFILLFCIQFSSKKYLFAPYFDLFNFFRSYYITLL